MKKLIALVAFVLVGTTAICAQEVEKSVSRANRKTEKDAERAKKKTKEQTYDAAAYQQAVQALNDKQFVLEADQVIFRSGQSAYVTPITNFVMMNGSKATVQIAFNTPNPGPNGIGGITVDGTASDVKMTIDKKGNVNYNFGTQGVGVSAQVFISLTNGGNKATVTVNPNFNSNTLTLNGKIVPLDQSDVFKGRSW